MMIVKSLLRGGVKDHQTSHDIKKTTPKDETIFMDFSMLLSWQIFIAFAKP